MSAPIEPTRLPTCGDAGGVTEGGAPCAVSFGLSPSNGRCLHHDEERSEQQRLNRLLGVKRSAEANKVRAILKATTEPANLPKDPPDTLERLAAWHRWAARAVATGEISPQVAREVTGSLKELRPTLIQLGLEARVRELERALQKARREGGHG